MKRLYILFIVCTAFTAGAANTDAGKSIFSTRCTACHSIEAKVVGPALKGVGQKYSKDWIISFIQSSQTMIKNGDANAVKIFNEMNQVVMPDHKDLSRADIEGILAYIDAESGKAAQPALQVNPLIPAEVKGSSRPLSGNQLWLFVPFMLGVAVLVYIFHVVIAARQIINEHQAALEESKKVIPIHAETVMEATAG
jgi:cytochrome c551/c552